MSSNHMILIPTRADDPIGEYWVNACHIASIRIEGIYVVLNVAQQTCTVPHTDSKSALSTLHRILHAIYNKSSAEEQKKAFSS